MIDILDQSNSQQLLLPSSPYSAARTPNGNDFQSNLSAIPGEDVHASAGAVNAGMPVLQASGTPSALLQDSGSLIKVFVTIRRRIALRVFAGSNVMIRLDPLPLDHWSEVVTWAQNARS